MALLKRTKKIAKLSILVGIRELWGLGCNLYLLTYQPFLTLRTIRAKRDKSQSLLVGMVAISPLLAYGLARAVLDILMYGRWMKSVGLIFGLTLLIELLILGYLGYWAGVVIGKNHKDEFLWK
jgi:hypothetical protein